MPLSACLIRLMADPDSAALSADSGGVSSHQQARILAMRC
jgi:hypothetical protein